MKFYWKIITGLISVTFTLTVLWVLYKADLLYVAVNYLFKKEYREAFLYEIHGLTSDSGFIQIMYQLIKEHRWEFDYILSQAAAPLSIVIPMLASISGILLFLLKEELFQMSMYRSEGMKSFLTREGVKLSFVVAIGIYFGCLMQYGAAYIFAKGQMFGNTGSQFLLDIVSLDFYFQHPYLYWMISWFVRFFIAPFCYSLLSCSCGFLLSSLKNVIWASNLYYYGLSLAGIALMQFHSIGVYISPYMFLTDGTAFHFVNYRTPVMMITGFVIPGIASMISLMVSSQYAEV